MSTAQFAALQRQRHHVRLDRLRPGVPGPPRRVGVRPLAARPGAERRGAASRSPARAGVSSRSARRSTPTAAVERVGGRGAAGRDVRPDRPRADRRSAALLHFLGAGQPRPRPATRSGCPGATCTSSRWPARFGVSVDLPRAAAALPPALDGPGGHRLRAGRADARPCWCSTSPPARWCPRCTRYWLVIHVLAAIIASGAFAVGALASALYLVKDRADPPRHAAARRLPRPAAGARRRSTGSPTGCTPSASRSGRSRRWSPGRSGRSTPGAATGAGTPRRSGRSSPGWSTPPTCTPGRPPAGRARPPRSSRWSGFASLLFNFVGINFFFGGGSHALLRRRLSPASAAAQVVVGLVLVAPPARG